MNKRTVIVIENAKRVVKESQWIRVRVEEGDVPPLALLEDGELLAGSGMESEPVAPPMALWTS